MSADTDHANTDTEVNKTHSHHRDPCLFQDFYTRALFAWLFA